MRLYIAGQDARAAYLTELAGERGHETGFCGPWDAVVLDLPRSNLPTEPDTLPKGQLIFCGMTTPDFDRTAEERGWQLVRVLQDERYVKENAVLSAEGAIFAAMRQADFALGDAECLVIGYGRIGRALTGMLRGLHARVTVAARRLRSRLEAGEGSIDIPEIGDVMPRMDVVFNTVPAPVLGREKLEKAKPSALLLELASRPYGIDLQAAEGLELRCWLESGIPGRYCPKSAAKILLDLIERRCEK